MGGWLPIAKEPNHYPSLYIFVSSFWSIVKGTKILSFVPVVMLTRSGQEEVGKGRNLTLEQEGQALCWELVWPKPSRARQWGRGKGSPLASCFSKYSRLKMASPASTCGGEPRILFSESISSSSSFDHTIPFACSTFSLSAPSFPTCFHFARQHPQEGCPCAAFVSTVL